MYRYIILLIIVIIFSCDSNLDLYPLANPSEAAFYKTESEIDLAFNEVYRQLGIHYDAGGIMDLYGEQYSDNTEIIAVAGTSGAYIEIDRMDVQANNSLILKAWDQAYSCIFICNNIIDVLNTSKVEINSQKKNQMILEATLIRSLVYFNLIRAFGQVPYIDEVIEPLDSYNYLRVDLSVIYDKLINDLINCRNNLPDRYDDLNTGRVTKYSAAAILAKIYMTLDQNNLAKSELELIINSGRYSLDSNDDGVIDSNDLKHIFSPETKNCSSSILEAQYKSGTNAFNSNHQRNYMPFYYSFYLPGDTRLDYRGNGYNTPSKNLIDEFEEDDVRKNIFLREGYIDLENGNFVSFPFTMKFYDLNWDNPGNNFAIIRYADILLMYSEVTEDPKYLNQVRARAGLPGFESNQYPHEKFPNLALAIEHERRIELCSEFHRQFDLKRSDRMKDIYPDFTDKYLLFPIPEFAIDVNPKLTQNPGY